MVATATDRSEQDFPKRFNDINIDWSVIEKRLIRWGELFRHSKKLRVDISFNYVDSQPQTAGTTKQGSKRSSSVTQRMLVDRAAQLDAEEDSGHPSI